MMKQVLMLLCACVLLCGCVCCRPARAEDADVPVRTVVTGNVEMDYVRFGEGARNFVILPGLSVHSVMGSAAAVAAAYADFAENYTVWLFDPPKNLREGYTVTDLAEDTAQAMQALGIENAEVFGVSMGGMIAIRLGLNHAELVHRLVLASTPAAQNEAFAKTIADWTALAAAKDESGLLAAFADGVYSPATLALYRDYLIESNRGITDGEYARFIILAGCCGSFDALADLKGIQCPVLVLGAEGDSIVTAAGLRQVAEALDCDMYLYGEEYGHGVYDEAPDFKQRILDFLSR